MADPVPAHLGLEAEADDYDNDGDSAMGTAILSSTTSINSSIMKYREENGRTYHAYKVSLNTLPIKVCYSSQKIIIYIQLLIVIFKDGQYLYPNDEKESDRLDLQHHLCNLTFDGKLFIAPIPKDKKLHNAIDLGTGTGIWAIDFADEHPETKVLGVDLSPIQPPFIPPNLMFQIDDLEEPWIFSQKFDFIYSRMMIGSIANFPALFQQCFDNLSDGGWIETLDISFPIVLSDGEFPKDSAFKKW